MTAALLAAWRNKFLAPCVRLRFSRPQRLLAEGKILKVMRVSEQHNAPFAADVLASIAAACAGADVIVTSALTQTATMSVAEKLSVPWVRLRRTAAGRLRCGSS
jgi:hypothetical protein